VAGRAKPVRHAVCVKSAGVLGFRATWLRRAEIRLGVLIYKP
jgi:hypothetical protein